MRRIIATAFIVAAVAGWVAATTTRAGTVKTHDDFPSRYSIGGGLPTLPIVY